MSKLIRISEEAHFEAKIAAAKQEMTLEDWATMILLRGAKNPSLVDVEIGTAANGREAQEQR